MKNGPTKAAEAAIMIQKAMRVFATLGESLVGGAKTQILGQSTVKGPNMWAERSSASGIPAATVRTTVPNATKFDPSALGAGSGLNAPFQGGDKASTTRRAGR